MSDTDETATRGPNGETTGYDKLVRDEIPAVIRADGTEPVTERVDGAAYERRLAEKLREETAEFCEARDPKELADVLAVVDTLVEQVGRETVERLREQKAAERGRFDDGVVLLRVETNGSGRSAEADGESESTETGE